MHTFEELLASVTERSPYMADIVHVQPRPYRLGGRAQARLGGVPRLLLHDLLALSGVWSSVIRGRGMRQ